MSVEEFVTWQAFLRRHPRGLRWDNWAQATLAREINLTQPRTKGARVPKLDLFVWKPPEPLFVTREKDRARRRSQRKQRAKSAKGRKRV